MSQVTLKVKRLYKTKFRGSGQLFPKTKSTHDEYDSGERNTTASENRGEVNNLLGGDIEVFLREQACKFFVTI